VATQLTRRAGAPLRTAAPARVADQVFVDRSGRRRKVVVATGVALAGLALTALAALGAGLVAGGPPGAVPGWPAAERVDASGAVVGRSPAPGASTPRGGPRRTPDRGPVAPTSAGTPASTPTATGSVRPGRGQGRSNRPTHSKSPGKPG
jgi:hypothetical protein